MKLQPCAPACLLCILCGTIQAQEWTEAQVLDKFMQQSPYVREARARIDAVRAAAEGRTLLPNPNAVVTREGAGYAAFFQIEQQLPISGRRNLLKQVGGAEIRVAESDSAGVLWSARTDLRFAFYRLITAQRRQTVVKDGMQEIEEVARVLSVREREGEGSRYDRLRAQRELAEYRSQLVVLQTDAAQARAALLSYLPSDTKIDGAAGELATSPPPASDALVQRALLHRFEYITEQRQIERYRLEARAAGRLRYPDPLAIAGMKRGEVVPGLTQTASAIGINIPLPFFNKGQTEVARSQAEIERAIARRDLLERRIRAEVTGAADALNLRRGAIEQYRREVNQIGTDLNRIARVAYQEGEIGILELLDSYRVTRQALLRLVDLQALAKDAQIELDRAVGEEVLP